MKIEVFAVCYNEELLLPYFLRHYSQFADIFIFDNYSTDRSVKIAQDFGAHITMFDTGNEMREDMQGKIRNDCWRESKADWVIVVDIDEFVYHKNLPVILEATEGTVVMPRTFNMYSDVFPKTNGQIYEEVTMGIDGQGKMNLFRPSEIKEMNYDAGCHNASPKGNFILNVTSEILMLHFRFLSPEYVIWKNFNTHKRQSEVNIQNGWNWHFGAPAHEVLSNFRDTKPRLVKIL